MNIKINGVKHQIVPISQLDYRSFNKIVAKNEVFDLKEYISLFVDLSVEDLMDAKIDKYDFSILHKSIFDTDIESTIKRTPKIFEYNDHQYYTEELSLDTFGKHYLFGLYLDSFQDGKIGYYDLGIYCLACMLNITYDQSDIEKTYEELSRYNWKKVLPAAFFLLKKSLKKKKGFTMLLIAYTLGLKRIALLSRPTTNILRGSIKKLQLNY